MKDPKIGIRPITAKRQKILAQAFEQLRKSRSKVDPGILSKIRNIVRDSPAIMRKLGLGEDQAVDTDMPLSQPERQKPVMSESKPVQRQEPMKKVDYEEVDQAKNMEIMAKLMILSPDQQENIKKIIKKSGK